MARRKNEIPTYLYHRARDCGKARFDGVDVYFPGKFNSPESKELYRRTLAEWLATGRLPRQAEPDEEGTVNQLLLRCFEEFVVPRFVKNGVPTSERRSYAVAFRPARELFGMLLVSEFGPKCLIRCRQEWIRADYTRSRINGLAARLVRAFRWGVANAEVMESTWRTLTAVEPLWKGEGGKESVKVLPVPEECVYGIARWVTPPVWIMIRLQLLTGARPGEICSMRTRDVFDRVPDSPAEMGRCRVYIPDSHKTEHHGRSRLIFLGPQAWEILEPWLRPWDPEAAVFSPREARAYFLARKSAESPTHRRTPRPKIENPKRAPGRQYTVSTYNQAIAKACEQAGVPHWHPNQLRHTAATKLRAKYKLELARVILGHASAVTTETYAEKDLVAAITAMSESG
jgi:integrase